MQSTTGLDWFGAIGTWVSGIAVVVSVYFLWRQLGHLRRTLQITSYHQVQNLMIDIDRYFIENIESWKYFREDCDHSGVDGPSRNKLDLVAEMLLDHFDNVFHQRDLLPKETYDGFVAFMREIYNSSPVFREFVNVRKSEEKPWYNPEFIGIFDERQFPSVKSQSVELIDPSVNIQSE